MRTTVWMKYLALLILGIALCSHVQAACVMKSGSTFVFGISPGTVYVPRNAAVGTVVWDSGEATGGNAKVACTGGFNLTTGYNYTPGGTGIDGVYQTSNPGIGIRIYYTNSVTAPASKLLRSPQTVSYTYPTNGYDEYGPMGRFRVQLVVTGTVTSGSVGNYSSLSSINYAGVSYGNVQTMRIDLYGFYISAGTCSVTTPSLTVKMPTAKSTALPSVGSTTGDTSFNIGLSCNQGVNIYTTLADATNPSNRGNQLSLTPGSTAKGVAYQIVSNNNGALMSYGADSATSGNQNQAPIAYTTGGNVSLPFTLRYVRTGTVTGGSANATATFTMSYQ